MAYNRARKEYAGEKIAAAINLIMVSLIILFCCDFADYFFSIIFHITRETISIIKILLRLTSFCVLFFGGLRFFVSEPVDNRFLQHISIRRGCPKDTQQEDNFAPNRSAELTVMLKETSGTHPKPETLVHYLKKHNIPIVVPCLVIVAVATSYYLSWRTDQPTRAVDKKSQKKKIESDGITEEQKQKIQTILARIKQEKNREREVLARIEKVEKKEREILDRIEKEHQKEREELNKIKQKKKEADKHRLAKIREENKHRLRKKIEKEKTEALKIKEIDILNCIIASAEESLRQKKYSEAKNGYETALRILEESIFKDQNEFLKCRIKIENALRDEEIIFGSQGYIYYKEKWITPKEYEKKLYDAGFVKYKGKLKKFMELKDLIIGLTHNDVKAYLTSKYSGRNIHKKNIKFNDLILNRNTGIYSEFTIYYKWEVWTFSEIGEGKCSLDIRYDANQDKWKIIRECEER
ncbi:hypothetical protein BuS5_03666 [Desulfosarcina sp. BuS5]|uniref:hypothetical protein n=1 Tax=Desulfosarcina sp. BuS5 TaxID=933262 RepID=UPI000480FEF4|nr:hypothetical protein [Desulfosarcina sp. BuS5]WDN90695.1 hypothetical protein BuS5_03666 [Desulfosarcina sp. BuS5]